MTYGDFKKIMRLKRNILSAGLIAFHASLSRFV